MINEFKLLGAAALALGLTGFSVSAATITLEIQNLETPPTTFGSLSYEGTAGDILGFYGGGTENFLAERFAAGNNAAEEALVESLTGLTMVDLGGTELPIVGSSATVAGNTYFTAKFAQSVGVFWNTTDNDIVVTFISSNECQSDSSIPNNQCGGISHYKVAPDGSDDPGDFVVPLPAGLPLVLTGLGVMGVLRARKRKQA